MRPHPFSLIFTVSLACAVCSCSHKASRITDFNVALYQPEFAVGYSILGMPGAASTIIESRNPWQGAEGVTTRLFISRDGEEAPDGFDGQTVADSVERVVCMSSTHVAMLSLLDEEVRIAGVSGIDYIYNPKLRGRDPGPADVGYDSAVDFERLVALDPDVVLLYGIGGASRMEPKLRELGIPYMYVGEYLEQSPLGRAEWTVVLGELLGRRADAEAEFQKIRHAYDSIASLVAPISYAPTVMVNTPYSDSWFMPSSRSYQARIILDAGGRPAYLRDTDNTSVAVDLEEAYSLASKADVWINTGQIGSLDELRKALPKFSDTRPVTSDRVYNSTLRVSDSGANDFWESGSVRPDLVLTDLVKIFHPAMCADREFTYYKKLE